jgi:radical SAM protein with 4Fe4S-binding SPASM domain
MHPDIMKIIGYLRRKELGVDLFTNGTLVTEEKAKALYDFGVEPVVKLNSLCPEVQDLLADHPGTFDAIQRGLDALQKAGYPDPEHDLGVESIICAQNYGEIPAMWRWARSRGIVPYFEMITFQGRARQRLDLNVSVAELEKLFFELSRIDRAEFGFDWEPHPPIAALSCSRHEYSITITASGFVQPCTGVDMKVGNIRHDSLANILAGNPIVNCLRDLRVQIKGACRECELLGSCYGCRGLAYHVTGDFLASDPLCWRNPKHLK